MLFLLYLKSPLNIKGQYSLKSCFYATLKWVVSPPNFLQFFVNIYFGRAFHHFLTYHGERYRANFLQENFFSVKRKSLKINLNSPNIHKCFKSKYQDPHVACTSRDRHIFLKFGQEPNSGSFCSDEKKNKCTWSHDIVKLLEALLFHAR